MPKLHAEVDFSIAPEFLDKELYQEVVDEKKGRRYADRLAKVSMKNGQEKWVLIHVEVQSSRESEFSERTFQYFYRIYDRHKEKIIALAVHTSSENIERMKRFEYEYFGTKLIYSYNNYKTEDYSDAELKRSENIFSKVVLAAKAVHQTKDEVEKRYRFKRRLMRKLIRSENYSRTAVAATFYFIDYLLQLPEEETKRLSKELGPEIRKERGLMELYNEENASPTVINSFAEQLDRGFAKGREQGIEQSSKNIAKKLMAKGMPLETIADVTGLSLDEVTALEDNIVK